MAGLEDRDQVPADTLADWRAWLAANHGRQQGVWLLRWKQGAGPHLRYGDARDEALCWGWIDSLPRKLDDQRSLLLMSPRCPGSAWSAVNRARVDALLAEGRMQPPGLAAVERARRDGRWELLAQTDALEVPPDLAEALAATPPAADRFVAFAPSARRGILEWLALAKRPETRARRVAEIARLAALGLRANFPESRIV